MPVYRLFLRVSTVGAHVMKEDVMHGYVAQRRGRFYAVIYEGGDPVTGKEVRRWHPAGTDRAEAERLAATLAATAPIRSRQLGVRGQIP